MEKGRTFAPAFGNGSGAPQEVLKKKLPEKFGGKAGKSLSLHPLSEKKEGGQDLKEFYDKPYINDTETVQGSSLTYNICISEVPRETVNT